MYYITILKGEECIMILYERVSELAKKQGISVFELADKLNLSRNSVYSWKKSSPKAETLEKVADYFHTTTDYLLGRTDDPNIPSTPEEDFDDLDFDENGEVTKIEHKKKFEGYFRLNQEGLEGQTLEEYIDDVEAYAELRRKKLLEKKNR